MCPKFRPTWNYLIAALCLLVIGESGASVAFADELDKLLVEYRAGGLPFPPEDARLVRFWAGATSGSRLYHLGFWLKPQNEGQPATILVGTRQWQVERHYEGDIVFIDRDKLALDGANPEWTVRAEWHDPTFWINSSLATAIQCRARGWNQLAAKVFERSLKEACGQSHSPFYQHANQQPKTALAEMEWAHWGNELVTPGTNRGAILRRMRQLVTAHETLDNADNRVLLESLEAAVKPSGARAGSVESTVDGLTEVAGLSPPLWCDFFESDPHYLTIVESGFDAIPALIDHLDDCRLTRSIYPNHHAFPSRPQIVGEVASHLLDGIREHGFKWHAIEGQAGWVIEKADAKEWWNAVKGTGEEQFLVQNVLTRDHQAGPPNEFLLWILAKKYPRRLSEVYKTLLDERPGIYSDDIATLIRHSPIEDAVQVALFIEGAKHRMLEHRRVALRQLIDLDHGRFVDLLVKTIDELPRTPGDSPPCRTEASFANLVIATDAVEAWSALDRAARRSDSGLRMEFLDSMGRNQARDRQRKQRLEFLAGFLDDTAVRKPSQVPTGFGGCCYAGYRFPRLEVRNLAAMSLASLLNINDQADPNWGPAKWAFLRSKIREALEAESIPSTN